MRLYRAMIKGETILNSDKRAFEEDINYLDEVYSHIVKSYCLTAAKDRKIIFSFTDDIKIAEIILEKNPEYYDRIGYIDIDRLGVINDETILFAYPVFTYNNWVNLLGYSVKKIDDLSVNCINYKAKPQKIIGSLVPSQKGVVSWAFGAREYAVICKNLEPTILSEEEILRQETDFQKTIECEELIDYYTKSLVVNNLLKETDSLNIQPVRKKALKRELNATLK